MRPVKDPSFSKQTDTHTRTLALAQLRSELDKQRLDVRPVDIAADGSCKYQFQCLLMFVLHFAMVPYLDTVSNSAQGSVRQRRLAHLDITQHLSARYVVHHLPGCIVLAPAPPAAGPAKIARVLPDSVQQTLARLVDKRAPQFLRLPLTHLQARHGRPIRDHQPRPRWRRSRPNANDGCQAARAVASGGAAVRRRAS